MVSWWASFFLASAFHVNRTFSSRLIAFLCRTVTSSFEAEKPVRGIAERTSSA